MTTKEDKIRLRNKPDYEINRDILQACIIEDIDAGKLKLIDANFLLFRLRSMSLLNDMYKVECTCPRCNTVFIDELELSKVPIKYFENKDLAQLKTRLPINQQEIEFKYPSLNDLIHFGEKIRDFRDMFPDKDITEEIYTSSNVLYIDKINGVQPLVEELDGWIEDLDIIDSRALRDIINEIDALYGFETDIKAICPNCRNVMTHNLPITSELFTPSK